MSEIVLVVDFILKPEMEEKAVALLRSLIEPTLKEEGCIYYNFYSNYSPL